MTVKPKTITCAVCGIRAKRVRIKGKPWLETDAIEFNKNCVERSVVSEPFRCPNILSGAMDADLVGKDGSWIGWGTNAA
jgi:hypothetical protein